MSSDDLREIFTYQDRCISDTHDTLNCKRCRHVLSDGARPAHEPEVVRLDVDEDNDSDSDSDSHSEPSLVVDDGTEEKHTSNRKKGTKVASKEVTNNRTTDESVESRGSSLTQIQRSRQIGNPSEDQIALWGHHAQLDTVIDDVLRGSDRSGNISFVFELRVPPMVLPAAATAAAGIN